MWQKAAREGQGRGPMIVLSDASGSTKGPQEGLIKGITQGLLESAHRQNGALPAWYSAVPVSFRRSSFRAGGWSRRPRWGLPPPFTAAERTGTPRRARRCGRKCSPRTNSATSS